MKEQQMHSNWHYFKSCGPEIHANVVIIFFLLVLVI